MVIYQILLLDFSHILSIYDVQSSVLAIVLKYKVL